MKSSVISHQLSVTDRRRADALVLTGRRGYITDDGQLLRGDLRPIAATLNKSLKRQPVWRLCGRTGIAFLLMTDNG
jgi:hypothetical protein